MPMILCQGRQSSCLGYLRAWGWRQNQKLSESRTTGGGAKVGGDERWHCGGVRYLMGEGVGWRDPEEYMGIKWEYCTRRRTAGQG